MELHDELHDDDKPIGRLLSRREMLALLGGSGAVILTGLTLPQLVKAQSTATPSATELPSCVVRPELTEGPYFVDEQLERFDIRLDSDGVVKAGIPLLLTYRVTDVSGGQCAPLAGAQVDIWHCDAEGEYSGVQDQGFDTTDELWLRGYNVTNEEGIAEFLTIVPGWYSGRAVHIHFKIRTESTTGESYEFTSQLFFDPEMIDEIYLADAYVDKGSPDTPNTSDNIFQSSEGLLTLSLAELAEEDITAILEHEEFEDTEAPEIESGFKATFDIGLDLSDMEVGASDSAGGQGSGGGRPPRG